MWCSWELAAGEGNEKELIVVTRGERESSLGREKRQLLHGLRGRRERKGSCCMACEVGERSDCCVVNEMIELVMGMMVTTMVLGSRQEVACGERKLPMTISYGERERERERERE